MPIVNIYNYIETTISEGPGKRFTIWFQGCLKRCKGCCNQELLRVVDKNILSVDDICKLILKSKKENNIEGVTFLGGEPMLQVYQMLDIAEFCKENNLTTMVFSGYYKEEIFETFPHLIERFKQSIDILVDGPFQMENLDNERKWIGSRNQKIHFFSDKYTLDVFYKDYKKSVEIRIDDEGVLINGWPFKTK